MTIIEAIAKIELLEPMISSLESRLSNSANIESLVNEANKLIKQVDSLIDFNTKLGSRVKTNKHHIKVEIADRIFYVSEEEHNFKKKFSGVTVRLMRVFKVLDERAINQNNTLKESRRAIEVADLGAVKAIANIYKIKNETSFITIEQLKAVINCCMNSNTLTVLNHIVNSMETDKKQKISFRTLTKRYLYTYCSKILQTEINMEAEVSRMYINHIISQSLIK